VSILCSYDVRHIISFLWVFWLLWFVFWGCLGFLLCGVLVFWFWLGENFKLLEAVGRCFSVLVFFSSLCSFLLFWGVFPPCRVFLSWFGPIFSLVCTRFGIRDFFGGVGVLVSRCFF